MIRIAVFLISLLTAGAACAQSPGLPYTYPFTVGTGSVQVLAANPQRKRVEFVNPNPTALIAVCPSISRATSAAITCTVNGAGSITLLPYASYRFEGVGQPGVVNSAWNAIASAGASALTVLEWE